MLRLFVIGSAKQAEETQAAIAKAEAEKEALAAEAEANKAEMAKQLEDAKAAMAAVFEQLWLRSLRSHIYACLHANPSTVPPDPNYAAA